MRKMELHCSCYSVAYDEEDLEIRDRVASYLMEGVELLEVASFVDSCPYVTFIKVVNPLGSLPSIKDS